MKHGRPIALLLSLAVIFFVGAEDRAPDLDIPFRTAREADTSDTPTWPIDPEFKKDAFTFARLVYKVDHYRHGEGHTLDRWAIDFPKCDLNLSYRLQQVTSMKVDPDGRVVKISEKEMAEYPFIYVIEPGRMALTDEEVPIIRNYCLNGGFLMFDDFWGHKEWANFASEMKRVFPDRPIVDLPLDHPIFHSVFDLKQKPQVPGMLHFTRYGRTYEIRREGGTEEVHYRGIFDDKDRLMMLICHNTDLGDGWEREGDNEEYFRQFSEKWAYPMGINAIVYAMTH